jgi:hypothetical protein
VLALVCWSGRVRPAQHGGRIKGVWRLGVGFVVRDGGTASLRMAWCGAGRECQYAAGHMHDISAQFVIPFHSCWSICSPRVPKVGCTRL